MSDVTILIPLHHSESFLKIIDSNIRNLHESFKIIVSDPFETDQTLNALHGTWAAHGNIAFIGQRDIESGWIPHYNDLLLRVTTPYFMWLPHDDDIDATYVQNCLRQLENKPELSAVVGHLEAIAGEGLIENFHPLLPARDTVKSYKFQANFLLDNWNLGILFRAIFRTKDVLPILKTYDGDQWADIVWAYGFCLRHQIDQETTAIYKKRFYLCSTHSQWRHHVMLPACLPFLVREIDRALNIPEDRKICRDEMLSSISQQLIEHLENKHLEISDLTKLLMETNQLHHNAINRIREHEDEISYLKGLLEIERQSRESFEVHNNKIRLLQQRINNLKMERDTFLRSRSWQLTAPLRRMSRILGKWQ